jgi:hypothetical protein
LGVGSLRLLLFVGIIALVVLQYRSIRRRGREAPVRPLKRGREEPAPLWQQGMATPIADATIAELLYPGEADTGTADEVVAPRWAMINGAFVTVFDYHHGRASETRKLSCARFELIASCPRFMMRPKQDSSDALAVWDDLHAFETGNAELERSFRVFTADDHFAGLLLDRDLVEYLLAEPRLRIVTILGTDAIVAFDALEYVGLRSVGDRGDELARFVGGVLKRIPPTLAGLSPS